MSTFNINAATLKQLLHINRFVIDDSLQLAFTGIRGCIMTNPQQPGFPG